MPIILDLAPVKESLESSAKVFNSLTSDFISQSAGAVTSAIPGISSITEALPSMATSLANAASGIGTALVGEGANIFPKMQGALENLIPNTSKLTDLCSGVLDKAAAGIAPIADNLKNTLSSIKEEAAKVASTANSVIAPLIANAQQAISENQGLINEVTNFANTLGNYANDVGAYLFNPTGGVVPHFSQIVGSISTDQLLTTANNIKNFSSNIPAGAITSTLYQATGTIREMSTRLQNKASMYENAQLSLGEVFTDLVGEMGNTINRFKRTTPELETGI